MSEKQEETGHPLKLEYDGEVDWDKLNKTVRLVKEDLIKKIHDHERQTIALYDSLHLLFGTNRWFIIGREHIENGIMFLKGGMEEGIKEFNQNARELLEPFKE